MLNKISALILSITITGVVSAQIIQPSPVYSVFGQRGAIPNLSGAVTTSGSSVTTLTTVPVSSGGTGLTTLTTNNVLLGNGTSSVGFVAPGNSGNVLTSNGTTWASTTPATAPVTSVFTLTGAIGNLTGDITTTNSVATTLKNTGTAGTYGQVTTDAQGRVSSGTVISDVAHGGTGAATLTTNNVLLGNGTSAVQVVAPGTSGNVLTSNGTTWASTTPGASAVTSVFGQTGAVPNLSGDITTSGSSTTTLATVPVGKGGTGVTTLPAWGILLGNTTSAVFTLSPSAVNNLVPTSSGATWVKGVGVAQNYITGFGLSNDGTSPNTVLDIASGLAADNANATVINGTTFTKSTAGTWTAGTGNNGMGASLTIANNTWYHVYAIINAGAFDVYFDTSVTAANKPASTTAFRRIGSFLTNGSAQIIAFYQSGQYFYWQTQVTDYNNTPASSATLQTLTVPTGVAVRPIVSVLYSDLGVGNSWQAWSPGNTTAKNQLLVTTLVAGVSNSASYDALVTNTSAQIYNKTNGANTPNLILYTLGWVDRYLSVTP